MGLFAVTNCFYWFANSRAFEFCQLLNKMLAYSNSFLALTNYPLVKIEILVSIIIVGNVLARSDRDGYMDCGAFNLVH